MSPCIDDVHLINGRYTLKSPRNSRKSKIACHALHSSFPLLVPQLFSNSYSSQPKSPNVQTEIDGKAKTKRTVKNQQQKREVISLCIVCAAGQRCATMRWVACDGSDTEDKLPFFYLTSLIVWIIGQWAMRNLHTESSDSWITLPPTPPPPSPSPPPLVGRCQFKLMGDDLMMRLDTKVSVTFYFCPFTERVLFNGQFVRVPSSSSSSSSSILFFRQTLFSHRLSFICSSARRKTHRLQLIKFNSNGRKHSANELSGKSRIYDNCHSIVTHRHNRLSAPTPFDCNSIVYYWRATPNFPFRFVNLILCYLVRRGEHVVHKLDGRVWWWNTRAIASKQKIKCATTYSSPGSFICLFLARFPFNIEFAHRNVRNEKWKWQKHFGNGLVRREKRWRRANRFFFFLTFLVEQRSGVLSSVDTSIVFVSKWS